MTTSPPAPPRFAFWPRWHVGLMFMVQFIVLMFALGGVVPTLHAKGVSTPLLVVGTAGFLVAAHYLIAVIGGLIPVRCRHCRFRTRYFGFGWWPFTYRYQCSHCGHPMKLEMTAG